MKNKIFFLMLVGLLFVGVGSGGVSAACPEGMVSYWTFDDADNVGNDPQDTVGDNHGTNKGATTGVAGQVGEAFSFDGDWININDDASLDITNEITLSAWIKPSTIPADLILDNIISKGVGNGGWMFAVGTYQGGNLHLNLDTGSNDWTSAGTLTAGNWYHVVGTYNGSLKVLYIDGVEAGNEIDSGTIDTNGADVLIGDRIDHLGANAFNGLIDEVAIFNRALSPEEISALYALGVAGKGYCETTGPGNLTLSWVSPSESTYVAQNKFWNFTLNLSCSFDGDCGFVNVTLDPWMINELKQGKSLQLDEDGNVIGRPSNTEITGNVIKETNKEPAEKNWLEKIVEFRN